MNCVCCDSIKLSPLFIEADEYYFCNNCGLICLKNCEKKENFDLIRKHYQKNDPHEEVSNSKKSFYNFVLDYLSSFRRTSGKKILDIGCGYGYFLDMAAKMGWEPTGIEVVHDAVKISQKKIGYNKIFQNELKEACLFENSFDVITLWDVIAIVDNPYDELKECYRLLKKHGIIGIRTRNVLFQMVLYRFFGLIKKMTLRFGLKEPYVFNKYCFSSNSLYVLLSRLGFINIKMNNSPLTTGDPYNHMPYHYPVKLAKTCVNIFSKSLFWITRGRCLVGPSLLIWAEKA